MQNPCLGAVGGRSRGTGHFAQWLGLSCEAMAGLFARVLAMGCMHLELRREEPVPSLYPHSTRPCVMLCFLL